MQQCKRTDRAQRSTLQGRQYCALFAQDTLGPDCKVHTPEQFQNLDKISITYVENYELPMAIKCGNQVRRQGSMRAQ